MPEEPSYFDFTTLFKHPWKYLVWVVPGAHNDVESERKEGKERDTTRQKIKIYSTGESDKVFSTTARYGWVESQEYSVMFSETQAMNSCTFTMFVASNTSCIRMW